MAILLFIALLLSISNSSSATYCVCIDGAGDTALQTDIDYACGNGADCSAILLSGACYQPNTVKSHCDYAVNSYYQKMNQVSGSCNFSGTATVTNTLPSTVVSGCSYPASSSQASAATPTSSTSSTNSTTSSSTFSGFAPTGTDTTLSPSSGQSIKHHLANSYSTAIITLFFLGFLVIWV